MRKILLSALAILTIVGLFFNPAEVNATSGIPGSPRFGYGTHLHLSNDQTEVAIETAGNIDLDWIAIDIDWAALSPEPNSVIDWESLDQTIQLVQKQQISILVSLANPPDWALTASGPDPDQTGEICTQLLEQYPHDILAIEIFPGPNTTTGWKANPNPQAYVNLLNTVHQKIQTINPEIIIVSGGLTPISTGTTANINDLFFLEEMYAAGAAAITPIIGLRLVNVGIGPTEAPEKVMGPTIRHYEAIRNVMLANNHVQGLIWVTASVTS
jgi:polysaccharide biosynthesis protein PslG